MKRSHARDKTAANVTEPILQYTLSACCNFTVTVDAFKCGTTVITARCVSSIRCIYPASVVQEYENKIQTRFAKQWRDARHKSRSSREWMPVNLTEIEL